MANCQGGAGSLKILARREQLPNGSVAYYYRVENQSDSYIHCITLGSGIGDPWGVDKNCEFEWVPPGTQFGVDSTPVSWIICPNGWVGNFDQCEDSRYSLTFGISDLSAVIKPGQTLDGFKVVLTKDYFPYTTAHFMAHILRGGETLSDYLQGQVMPDASVSVASAALKSGHK